MYFTRLSVGLYFLALYYFITPFIFTQYHPLSSPNQSGRVKLVVLHYTVADFNLSTKLLAGKNGSVSAHYLVDTDGKIYNLVPETQMSWHAGSSDWGTYANLNPVSIGIEIINPNGNETPYTDAQVKAILSLCKGIQKRHKIPPANFIGHSDIAPGRKIDPGVLFPWAFLAKHGIGIWANEADKEYARTLYFKLYPQITFEENVAVMLKMLGYSVDDFFLSLEAFRRHFNPQDLEQDRITSTDIIILLATLHATKNPQLENFIHHAPEISIS